MLLLALFRCKQSQLGREQVVFVYIHGTMLHLSCRRVLAEKVFAFPIVTRADRTRYKSSAAIGTDIMQDLFDTGFTKRAFEAAYSRVGRIRRQRCVAVFTGGAQFQHTDPYVSGYDTPRGS